MCLTQRKQSPTVVDMSKQVVLAARVPAQLRARLRAIADKDGTSLQFQLIKAVTNYLKSKKGRAGTA